MPRETLLLLCSQGSVVPLLAMSSILTPARENSVSRTFVRRKVLDFGILCMRSCTRFDSDGIWLKPST